MNRPSLDNAVVIDFETPMTADYSIKKKTSARSYLMDPRFEVLSVAVGVGGAPIAFFHKHGTGSGTVVDGLDLIRSELSSGKWLVCHNAGFDALLLRLHCDIFAPHIFDTQDYASYVGDQTSLANLARRLGLRKLEAPPFDEASLRDPVLLERFAKYNAGDVRVTRAAFAAAIADPDFPDAEFEVIDMTARANVLGISLDEAGGPKLVATLHCAIEEVRQSISTNWPFDHSKANNAKYVAAFIESTFGVRLPSLKKNDAEILRTARANPALNSFVSAWQKVRSLSKCIGQVERLASLGDRIYSPLRYYAAHTGRFAGGGNACDNFNIHSLPKSKRAPHPAIGALRTLIVPEPGRHFVAADLSSIEVRVVAALAGEQAMLEILREGLDIYIWFGGLVFPGTEIINGVLNDHLRMLCKQAVLGLNFGMGLKKFSENVLGLMPETPVELIDRVFYMHRETFSAIGQLRADLWDAFLSALNDGVTREAGRCTFFRMPNEKDGSPSVAILLPSGRRLFYRSIVAVDAKTPWGDPCKDYWYTPSYEFAPTFARKRPSNTAMSFDDGRWRERVNRTAVIENVAQAVARDIMVHQMLAAARGGRLHPVFHVHDELVCACAPCSCSLTTWETPEKHSSGCPWAAAARELLATMSTVPATLPLLADVPLGAELSKGVWTTYAG